MSLKGSSTTPLKESSSRSVRSTVQNIQIAYGSPHADLYEDVLQCSSKASPKTVQQSFFNRRNELFTQINAGDKQAETKMDAVVMAFRLLENPHQRNEYDVWRRDTLKTNKQTTSTSHTNVVGSSSPPKKSLYSRHTTDYEQEDIPSNQYAPRAHEESFTSTAPLVSPQEGDDFSTQFSTHFSEAFGIPTTPSSTFIPSVFPTTTTTSTPPKPTASTTTNTKVTRVVTPPQEQLKKKKKHSSSLTSSSPSKSVRSSPHHHHDKSRSSSNPSVKSSTTRTVKSTTSSKHTSRSQPGRIIVTSPSDERGYRRTHPSSSAPDTPTDPDTESYTDEGTIESSVWTTDDDTATQNTMDHTIDDDDDDDDTLEEQDLYKKRKQQNWKANSHKLQQQKSSSSPQPPHTAYPGPHEKWTGGRVVGVIKEEVEGAYTDTCSAFDQVFNVFTLNDKDIKAVSGRIRKAKQDFFTE